MKFEDYGKFLVGFVKKKEKEKYLISLFNFSDFFYVYPNLLTESQKKEFFKKKYHLFSIEDYSTKILTPIKISNKDFENFFRKWKFVSKILKLFNSSDFNLEKIWNFFITFLNVEKIKNSFSNLSENIFFRKIKNFKKIQEQLIKNFLKIKYYKFRIFFSIENNFKEVFLKILKFFNSENLNLFYLSGGKYFFKMKKWKDALLFFEKFKKKFFLEIKNPNLTQW